MQTKRCRTISEITGKHTQNYAKTGAEIHEKTMNKQVRTFDGKSIGNMMVCDGAEPRFALHSSLILHFG